MLTRAKSSRRGYRAHITKTYGRIQEITEATAESTEPITATQTVSLSTALDQLLQIQAQLKELDERIAAVITEEKELEEEIYEIEEYQTALIEKITMIRKILRRHHKVATPIPQQSSRPTTPVTSPAAETEATPVTTQSHEKMEDPTTDGTATKKPAEGRTEVSSSVQDAHHTQEQPGLPGYSTRLPKLTLPQFSGDPLAWQGFWDSFEASVHSDPRLTGVQKFNYLRAQLLGDVARVVEGFPLTNNNYEHSVSLLKQRFAQPYKLVNAYMQALLGLTKPS